MRHRSWLRDVFEYWIAIAVLISLAYTPLSISNSLARFYTRLLDRAMPRLRRVAFRNLQMALPDLKPLERSEIVDGVIGSISGLLVTFARFPKIGRHIIKRRIRYEGDEHFEQAQRRGKGDRFATANLG